MTNLLHLAHSLPASGSAVSGNKPLSLLWVDLLLANEKL